MFYAELIERFGIIAAESDARDLLEEVVEELACDIQKELVEKDLRK